MKIKKIVIIGVGLIGGSLGKALLKREVADEVVGICRREVSLDKAIKEGSLTSGYVDNYEEALLGAEIIVIATPIHTIRETLDKLSKTINDRNVIVTDVGSTKKELIDYAEKYKDNFSFIGGHPLAGSEKTGVEFSTSDLFESSICVLTPTDNSNEEAKRTVKDLWESVGATVGYVPPEEHDKNLAFSSHLPHIVAYALAGAVESEFPQTMAATGFKDTTRIAHSDEVIWSDIFISNRDNVLKAIEKYKRTLETIEKSVKDGDEAELKKKLRNYKGVLDELFSKA